MKLSILDRNLHSASIFPQSSQCIHHFLNWVISFNGDILFHCNLEISVPIPIDLHASALLSTFQGEVDWRLLDSIPAQGVVCTPVSSTFLIGLSLCQGHQNCSQSRSEHSEFLSLCLNLNLFYSAKKLLSYNC